MKHSVKAWVLLFVLREKTEKKITADAPEEGVGITSTVDPPIKCYLNKPAENISPAVMDRKARSHIFEHFSQYLKAQQY